MTGRDFSDALLAWFDRHGRKDLPWQRTRDPYRIWVSEIMLQQTQVATVIPYYTRFIERLPDTAALARADLDEVLHLWTGLGYYARARNLQRAAQLIVSRHAGRFPRDLESLCALPGIGRSTAGAILAFAADQRHPILDGNARRVLARYHAIAGWPGRRDVEQRLWTIAGHYTPGERVAAYTQAIMDLGATICRRSGPACAACPLAATCAAHAGGDPEAYPGRRPRRSLPVKATTMLMIRDAHGRVLLRRRPPSGVWGGLWVFPECAPELTAGQWCRDALGLDVTLDAPWPVVRHAFSHFHLDITPIPARVLGASPKVMENPQAVWYNLQSPDARGLAAPVERLLQRLRNSS